jgi:hypothetical protein
MYSTIKKKPRPAKETNRIYGPKTRRIWMKTLPCAACGVVGYSENAHCAPPSEKGTGYKAGYEWIAPLCGDRGRPFDGQFEQGCHKLHDDYHWVFDEEFPDFNAEKAAADTEQAWQDHLKEKG